MSQNPSTLFRAKGISTIVIILIIVGVLVIGSGIWCWQKISQQPVQPPKIEQPVISEQSTTIEQPKAQEQLTEEKIIQPVQTPTATTSIFVVGKNGGTIISPNGKMKLKIPEGALTADAIIEITQIEANIGQVGPIYNISPDNVDLLNFLKPATITITYDPNTLPKEAIEWKSGIGILGYMDSWETLDSSVDASNHVITAEIERIYGNDDYTRAGVLPMFGE